MAGDALIVTAFRVGRDGKKFPMRIGRVILKGIDRVILKGIDRGALYLDTIPVGWDGSAILEPPQDRDGAPRGGGDGPPRF